MMERLKKGRCRMRRLCSVIGWSSLVAGAFALTLVSRPVQAEVYVAGQVGANVPNDFTDVQWSVGGGHRPWK